MDPSWAWENLGVNTAHLFFLNANMWVDPITYERTLLQSAMQHQDLTFSPVSSCWVDIDPRSDPLVRIVGRAALSLLKNLNGKLTYTIRGTCIRFSVHGSHDIRMHLQLECTEDAGSTAFFASGTVSLEVKKSSGGALPLWFPILLDHSREAASQRSLGYENNKDSDCYLEEGGLVAAFQRAYYSNRKVDD